MTLGKFESVMDERTNTYKITYSVSREKIQALATLFDMSYEEAYKKLEDEFKESMNKIGIDKQGWL